MANNSLKWLAMLGCFAAGLLTTASAQDSGALLDALVRKGVLTDQEAEDIRADLVRDHSATPWGVAGGKDTKSLSISGRIQTQYFSFDNDNVADSTGFIMRRVYLGAKAKVGADWTADFNYNFAENEIDKAFLQWGGDIFGQASTIDVGFRKVNFGYEETTSSANLKAIERSPATRFFVESPSALGNDRQLGAGSRRIGVFANFNDDARAAKTTGLYYGFAVTNPERQPNGDLGIGLGDRRGATNNVPALWADVGFSYKVKGVAGKAGAAVSHIREGEAFDAPALDAQLTGLSVYNDLTIGKFNLAAEFLTADLKDGAVVGAVTEDANPYGYWIQPSFMVTDKVELVARYSFVDGDGRGLRLRDLVRRSDSTITADELQEFYVGANYYFVGNSVKLQLGYIFGEAEIDGGASEETQGVRTQLQVLF